MSSSSFGRSKPEPEDGTGKEIQNVAPKKGDKITDSRINEGVKIVGGPPSPKVTGVTRLRRDR